MDADGVPVALDIANRATAELIVRLVSAEPDVAAALASLHTAMATNVRDWSINRLDAWLYGALIGWDESLPEVAARHGWSGEDVDRLRRFAAALAKVRL